MQGTAFPTSTYTHRVSYGETDTMGVLYYAEYLHIFERARGAFIRELGMSYATMEERGIFLPVRHAACRYRSPCRYDDEIDVQVVIEELGKASISFSYTVHRKNDRVLVAEGSTQHAFVDGSGKPCRVPQWFTDLLQ